MIITQENGVFTLRPGNDAEAAKMASFFNDITVDAVLPYDGRIDDPQRPRFSCPMFQYEDRRIAIVGTSEEDARAAFFIRDLCFYGSEPVTFVCIQSDENGQMVILHISQPCRLCGAPCIQSARVEWAICAECAAKCEHRHVRGLIHGGQLSGLRVGYYCKKCGTGKPQEPDAPVLTQAEYH
jgi:hypothetical protein